MLGNAFDNIEKKLVEAEETKSFVKSALESAGGALTGIEEAKELFFGGESPGFGQKIKGFFGFTLAQMENNPHFSKPEDLQKVKEIERMLLAMEKLPEGQEERFLKETVFGMK